MKFDIVINTDDQYVQHAMATLCSLFENNREHHIVVHVLQRHLSNASCEYFNNLAVRYNNEMRYYTVDERRLDGVQFRKNRPLSLAAYYRLMLASVLPLEIERVLYIDCDMIILRDISEIFLLELDNYALAASLDRFPYDQQHRLQLQMEADERTFCSGIMLVNLKYWRDNKVEEGLLEYAKRNRKVVYLHDQDVLNYYFKKKWFLLPPKWNCCAYSLYPLNYIFYKHFDIVEYVVEPMVYHYASSSLKPWFDMPSPNRDSYLKYLRISGYQDVKFVKQTLVKKLKMYLRTKKYEMRKLLFMILNHSECVDS
jgi:lipopolysaccharide biosynthesis glycosyltransferase